MTVYHIRTIARGSVESGARVTSYVHPDGIRIPAIVVGEGAAPSPLGVLPVRLPNDLYTEWNVNGRVHVNAGKILVSQQGGLILVASSEVLIADDADKVIVVMRTPKGALHDNEHTGGMIPAGKFFETTRCSRFYPFPGHVLVKALFPFVDFGCYVSSGSRQSAQQIALIPKNVWFRVFYETNLRAAGSHMMVDVVEFFYMWNGQVLSAQQREEYALKVKVNEPAAAVLYT